MRRFVVTAAVVGALVAGSAGTAMARDWHHPRPGPHGHGHHVGFHHPHHLSWWERLRLRLHHAHH